MNKRKMVIQSVDVRCAMYNIKLTTAVVLAILAGIIIIYVSAFRGDPKEMWKGIAGYTVLHCCCYFPAILVHVFRIVPLVKECDSYLFFNTVLSEYHTYRGKFYFTVSFRHKDSRQIVADTEAVYYAGVGKAKFEEWHNKEVLAAYNPWTKKVIVIGPAEKFTEYAWRET